METIELLRKAAGRMQEIMRAAAKAHDGIMELCAAIAAVEAEKRTDGRDLSVLTERQRQIFELLAGGVSVPDVAKRLKLSYRTVEAHRNTIRMRLKFKTVAELHDFAKALHGSNSVP